MSSRVNAIYESVLLQEMDERVIDYLNEHKDDLPFDHIFGSDDLRITIPIYSDPTAKEILDTLKRIRDYGGLDLDSGEVVRKIKLDPKYGQGDEKEQRMKITSAVSKLKISDEEKKKYLDWLARYKDNIKEAMGGSKYTIVLSRAPVDVVRMSDHSGISSCHSQGGEYFECAVMEAINGGAVAYVVDTEELKEYLDWPDNSLQDEEIFEDDIRYSSTGLTPMSRLRIRRLSDGEKELAIPDIKIYGDNTIPSFYQTVKSFLQEKQSESLEEIKKGNWKKLGGTYYDDNISYLVKKYYDVDDHSYYNSSDSVISPGHDYYDKDRERDIKRDIYEILNTLGEDCERIKDEFNQEFIFCEVFYDLNYDDGVYVIPYATGQITFNLEGVDFSDVDLYIEKDDIEGAKDGDFDNDIRWSALVYYLDEKCFEDLVEVKFSQNVLKVSFEDSENVLLDDYQYRRFCGRIMDFDNHLDSMDDDKWREIFSEIGLIPDTEGINQLNRLIENASEDMSYTNEIHGEKSVEWSYMVDMKPKEKMNDYEPVDNDTPWTGKKFANMVISFIEQHYTQPTEPEPLPSFKNFYESYRPELKYNDVFYENDLQNIYVNLTESRGVVFLELKLEVEKFTQANVDLLIWLDKSYKDLQNMATLAYLTTSRNISQDPYEKTDVNDLKRRLITTYGRFLD